MELEVPLKLFRQLYGDRHFAKPSVLPKILPW